MEKYDNEFVWAEKYRPKKIDDVILPQSIKAVAEGIVKKGKCPTLLFSGTAGRGKAQPLSSKIKTPEGWISMGDVRIGDMVSIPDGNSVAVIGIFPQGEKDIFRITFKDGRECESCGEHLWKTWDGSRQKWGILSTEKVLNRILTSNRGLHVPLLEKSDQGEDISLPLPSYFMGCMLGDGSFRRGSFGFSTVDVEILASLTDLLEPGYEFSRKPSSNCDFRIRRIVSNRSNRGISSRKNVFRNFYKKAVFDMGLLDTNSYTKFIPHVYKISSHKQKEDLLAGLIDTDGYVGKEGGISISTSSKQMAHDIVYIVRSIGGIAKIHEKNPTYSYKGKKCFGSINYNVSIRYPTPKKLSKLPRKRDRISNDYQYKNLKLGIKSISFVRKEVAQCILIDHPDHLYITDDFVVTHNTTLAKCIANELNADFMVINCSLESGIDTVRTKMTQFASTVSFTESKKITLLDEADRFSPAAQDSLKSFIEEFSNNHSIILTCNHKHKIIEPLHSRSQVIDFRIPNSEKAKLASQFFKRVLQILDNEEVEYDKKVVAEVVNHHFPDFRRCLNELQKYASKGEIDSGILVNFSAESFDELINLLKEKKFTAMRKWVAQNDMESSTLFRMFYDTAIEKLEARSIPALVMMINEAQYKDQFVVDKEINRAALLTEVLLSGDIVWK